MREDKLGNHGDALHPSIKNMCKLQLCFVEILQTFILQNTVMESQLLAESFPFRVPPSSPNVPSTTKKPSEQNNSIDLCRPQLKEFRGQRQMDRSHVISMSTVGCKESRLVRYHFGSSRVTARQPIDPVWYGFWHGAKGRSWNWNVFLVHPPQHHHQNRGRQTIECKASSALYRTWLWS